MKDPTSIFVTKPYLPPLEELQEGLNNIWESKNVANQGIYHQEFEQELSKYLGVPHVSLFTNCTIALIVAIRALELQGNIITSPFSFPATLHSLTWNNINPLFVDIDKNTFNIDVNLIEKSINDKTTAILAVHAFGNPCQVNKIENLAEKYNLKVIYDGAASLGSKCNYKSVLSFGDISVVSFHATKILNTFEGGAIISKSAAIKNKVECIRNFGLAPNDELMPIGINGKMSEFNSLLGLIQMKHFKQILEMRIKIAQLYNEKLNFFPNIEIPNMLFSKNYNFTYYPILFKDSSIRDYIYNEMHKKGIFVRKYYYPLLDNIVDLSSAENKPELTVANDISSRVICLPMYPDLSLVDQMRVINRLESLVSE